MEIQQRIRDGLLELAWSYVLDFENQANPFEHRHEAISAWRAVAVIEVSESDKLLELAGSLLKLGIHPKDALHVAAAISAGCDYFLTTDEMLLRKAQPQRMIQVCNPAQWIVQVEQ